MVLGMIIMGKRLGSRQGPTGPLTAFTSGISDITNVDPHELDVLAVIHIRAHGR